MYMWAMIYTVNYVGTWLHNIVSQVKQKLGRTF